MKESIEKELKSVFNKLGIEYFSVIRLSDTKITKPYLIERSGFSPECAIIFLVPYYSGDGENLSSYAVARDYHIFLQTAGETICNLLRSKLHRSAVVYSDHSPIDERDAASKCALGIIGDNGLLINEKYGSYIFIGEIITDATEKELAPKAPCVPEECIHCGRCLSECPMQEIGECLSALTQKKGALTEKERTHIKKYGSVWGCDICQKSCPYNRSPRMTPIEFFRANRTPKLTKSLLNEMSDTDFSERAYAWRGKNVLIRNMEICEED